MRYGLTFKASVYDFEREEAFEIVTRPGDYIRMQRWKETRNDGGSGELDVLESNYAVVWFALQRTGRLAEFGVPDQLDSAAIDAMADRMSVFVDGVEEDSLPLRKAHGR